ncbi:MAG: hypothetical protein ABIH63_03475 [archaeon]
MPAPIVKILFLLITLVFLLFSGCVQQGKDIKSICCEQCVEAGEGDVRGFDTSSETCSYYRDVPVFENGLPTDRKLFSSECVTYFNNSPMTVRECKATLGE